MKKYLHKCPKPTLVWSNSPVIRLLDKGSLRREEMDGPKTVQQYVSKKTGRTGYAGTKALKKTEPLGESHLFKSDFQVREYPAKYAAYLIELLPSFREIREGLPQACTPARGPVIAR